MTIESKSSSKQPFFQVFFNIDCCAQLLSSFNSLRAGAVTAFRQTLWWCAMCFGSGTPHQVDCRLSCETDAPIIAMTLQYRRRTCTILLVERY